MNTIIVQTKDGYMAEQDEDNLNWSSGLDKKIFKICSILSEINICSEKTYSLLPQKMKEDKNRKFIIVKKTGNNTLNILNKKYPRGLLISGPHLLNIAKNMGILNLIIINTLDYESVNKNKRFKTPFNKHEIIHIAEMQLSKNLVTNIYKMKDGKK